MMQAVHPDLIRLDYYMPESVPLGLGQDDLDHVAPASASERRLDEESRDLLVVPVYRMRSVATRLKDSANRWVASSSAVSSSRSFSAGVRASAHRDHEDRSIVITRIGRS